MYFHEPYHGCQRSSRSPALRSIETEVMLVVKRPLVQDGLSASIQSCCRSHIKIWPWGFDWTIEKPFLKRAAMVCCVSKISSYSWCQWMGVSNNMRVRVISVGTRGLFFSLLRNLLLQLCCSILSAPKRKDTWPLVLDHFSYSLYFNNHFLDKAHMQISLVL